MSSHDESSISANQGNPDEFIEDLLGPQFITNLNKQKENEK
jgi:hypothetical protein